MGDLKPLTEVELRVAMMVLNEYSNHTIARILGIHEVTVSRCLSSIYAKLGVESRIGIVKWVMQAEIDRLSRELARVSGCENTQKDEDVDEDYCFERLKCANQKKEEGFESLTTKERYIFILHRDKDVAGMKIKALALMVGIGESVLKKHLQSIYRKMNLPSRAALSAMSARMDLSNEVKHEGGAG